MAVPKRVEEALLYRLKQEGYARCGVLAGDFNLWVLDVCGANQHSGRPLPQQPCLPAALPCVQLHMLTVHGAARCPSHGHVEDSLRPSTPAWPASESGLTSIPVIIAGCGCRCG